MKRSQLSEEQIIDVLGEQEAGMGVSEVCRKHGILEAALAVHRDLLSSRLVPAPECRRETLAFSVRFGI